MTQRLYHTSQSLTAEVDVIACTPSGDRFEVESAQTPFHPQGGGQPSDTGWLGRVEVLAVRVTDGRVLHITSEPVPLGRAEAKVNAATRHLHAHLHSAGHLIGLIGERFGWQPVKAHHWPGESRVEFVPGEEVRVLDADQLRAEFEALREDELPVRMTLDEDGRRQIGFGAFAAYGCGGTHVDSTGDLRGLGALTVRQKKGRLIVQYDVVLPPSSDA
ncbi:alanyl-tRNA editing protein [Pseudomonas sp. Marseille-QA0892]